MLVPFDELLRLHESETGVALDLRRLHYYLIYALYFHMHTFITGLVAGLRGADVRVALGYAKSPSPRASCSATSAPRTGRPCSMRPSATSCARRPRRFTGTSARRSPTIVCAPSSMRWSRSPRRRHHVAGAVPGLEQENRIYERALGRDHERPVDALAHHSELVRELNERIEALHADQAPTSRAELDQGGAP